MPFVVSNPEAAVVGASTACRATRPPRSAATFGIGWGLAGICPGPGIVLLASGQSFAWIFIAAVCAGLFLAGRFGRS